MNQSLRGEINKELAKTMVWTIKNKQIDVHLPDRIVSIFEKRIDSIIKPLEEEQRDRTTVSEYNDFAIKKLREVKEMLK